MPQVRGGALSPFWDSGHGGVSLASAGPGNLVGGATAFVEEAGFQGTVEYGLWLLLGLVGERRSRVESVSGAGWLTQLGFLPLYNSHSLSVECRPGPVYRVHC